MIHSLSGRLEEKRGISAVVGLPGISFKVFTPERSKFPKPGSKIKLFTYLYIREEKAELYGFLEERELNFFETLISVSGIGPKLALGLLSTASPERLSAAIKRGEVSLLQKSSGIGKKTAERLIVELKDRIKNYKAEDIRVVESDRDIFEAMVALGYSRMQTREAIQKISPSLITLGERLKDALKKVR